MIVTVGLLLASAAIALYVTWRIVDWRNLH